MSNDTWMMPSDDAYSRGRDGTVASDGRCDLADVRGEALLDQLLAALTRYVVFPSADVARAVVLWIAATHAQAAWQHATRLVVKSPEKRCGKSRLLDLIEKTSHRPLISVNASVAAIFRSIDPDDPPTLIVDEADSIFGRKNAENTEELRGLLNAGFQHNRPAWRCVGPRHIPTPFPTFAMAALAAIGDVIPDTITDRAVVVPLRRRAPHEEVAQFRHRRDTPAFRDLATGIATWVRANTETLADVEPQLPVEDRAADAWEPLVAIADLAGGLWPERARNAALALTAEANKHAAEATLGGRLLADVRDVFNRLGIDALSSEQLVRELRALEESPWERFNLSQNDLARRLGKYGIRSERLRLHGRESRQVRGYKLDKLTDAFIRYVPESPSVTPSQTQTRDETAAELVTSTGVTTAEAVTVPTRESGGVTVGDTTEAISLLQRELGAVIVGERTP